MPMDEKKKSPERRPEDIPKEKRQKRLFPKTRAGIVLTEDEVQEIKRGRRQLRKDLRARGIKSKKDFELTASSLMLYFDKQKKWGLLLWLFHGRGLWALLAALGALMLVLFALSTISEMRGHFTINMSGGLFREGFSLSETVGFENPTTRLFAQPAEDVPCCSIRDILPDVNDHDGQHNEEIYFAYTYYIRNEGESTVNYTWKMLLNAESRNLSTAAWVMIFEDDQMKFYAKAREDGTQEAIPSFGDDSRGYPERPFYDFAAQPQEQYEQVGTSGGRDFYRIIPYSFESDTVVATGAVTEVEPQEVHKYTVVIWLEGDDPDCTNDLIGGHAGMEMNFKLETEEDTEESSFEDSWNDFWDGLTFWDELT